MRGKPTHGLSGTREYHIWEQMKARCLRSTHPCFRKYGARGISICERWMRFENFIADMGNCPEGMSIDRIDNDGDYEPSNCRWTTRLVQQNNRRCCVYIEHEGKTRTMSEWARELGFRFTTLSRRYHVVGDRPPHLCRPIHS